MNLRIRPRIKPRLRRRPVVVETVESSTVLIVLYKGNDVVYRLETPIEAATDGSGFVDVGSFMRDLDQSVTFDAIEVQARHRRHNA